jgi:hypothetical protein
MSPILRIALILSLALGAIAADGDDGWKHADSQTISLEKTPDAVKQRIEKESKGGEIKSLAKTTEDKKTVYIAEISMSGKVSKLTISESGKVIKTEEEKGKDGGGEMKGAGKVGGGGGGKH